MRLKVHLLVLPRWFGLPAACSAVALGCLLGGAEGWLTAVAIACGGFVMAWAHSMNTLLDYSWTGFDKGTEVERSHPKEYTAGQQPIAQGILSEAEVFQNALVWLVLSAVFASIISACESPWVWLPWALTASMTFLYSWGKLHYLCEVALGLGFGPFAVWLGMAAAGRPDFDTGFLAGLPFLLIFGFAAEIVDQWVDWEPNWPKGLRNIGALIGYHRLTVAPFVAFVVIIAYITQLTLVSAEILAPMSMLSLVAVPFIIYCMLYLEYKLKIGVLFGLGGIFVYLVLLTVGQAIGG